jgi:quercetin dioxygenase-like cupin family protein
MPEVTKYRWDDMPKERVSPTLERRIICGERMMLTHVYLKDGTIVPTHSHDNEQLTYILEGALHFWIGADGKQEVMVHAGEVLVIPSGIPHKAQAVGDTLDVDVFCPPRQDWLDKSDSYLRGAPAR